MPEIHDQYHGDPAFAELHVLTRERPLAREMLKTAEFVTQKHAVDGLPSTVFAWEDERRFPVHTKADTIASILYRSKCASFVPKHVDDKLSQACEIYGVDSHIFAATKTASAGEFREKVAYALEESQRLPLGSPAQIKLAEQVLNRDFDKLTLDTRADAYSRLLKQAGVHGVGLAPFTHRMAGLTASSTEMLRTWLGARASAVGGNEKYAAAYDKLHDALGSSPALLTDRKELVKLAGTIDQLDRGAGLDKHYDRKLPDPMQTVFNTDILLTKVAGAMCDLGGMQVPCETLMQLPPEIWHQVDMPEMAELAAGGDPNQFKQVFDTLPMDLKMVLGRQLG